MRYREIHVLPVFKGGDAAKVLAMPTLANELKVAYSIMYLTTHKYPMMFLPDFWPQKHDLYTMLLDAFGIDRFYSTRAGELCERLREAGLLEWENKEVIITYCRYCHKDISFENFQATTDIDHCPTPDEYCSQRMKEERKTNAAIRRIRVGNGGKLFTATEWGTLKKVYGATCLACGKSEPDIELTADHVIPLAKGGTNQIDNIQPLCRSCNSSKGTKIIDYRPTQNQPRGDQQ